MFLRDDQGWDLGAGGSTTTRGLARVLPVVPTSHTEHWHSLAARIDWVPDLGCAIGSRAWWRGVVTCAALCAATWALAPSPLPIRGTAPTPLDGAAWEEARAQGIAPLAAGATTGRRMASGDLALPLAEAPERPQVELAATLGEGDAFDRVLTRAGVSRPDAAAAAALVRQAVALDAIEPGTRIALTLGRRPDRRVARPLERMALRARFDLSVSLQRVAGTLAMTRTPIAIDSTPLRLQGIVGPSLYRAVRAAGAPAKIVEAYLRALSTKLSVGRDVRPSDRFDLVIERDRAATGETRTGKLLFAAVEGHRDVSLVRWAGDGGDEWWDTQGRNERRGFMGMPVQGHITSSFGWRMHPLLHFVRLHKGMDIGARYGSPIYAVLDGTVQAAGRAGGYGNFIKLQHAGGLASGYGHMSRFAVSRGQHVRQGQVIGYVGSTGLSTGPHLHWEVWRNGQAINPRSISFDSLAQLSGDELRRFKARVAAMLALTPG